MTRPRAIIADVRQLRIAVEAPDRVTAAGSRAYKRIAEKLFPGRQVNIVSPATNTYISFESCAREPERVGHFLALPPGGKRGLLLLDLSINAPALVRQVLLIQLMAEVCRRLESGQYQRFVFLLPRLPQQLMTPDTPLDQLVQTRPEVAGIILDSEGGGRAIGNVEAPVLSSLCKYYSGLFSVSDASLQSALESKILRRVGHFTITDPMAAGADHPDLCSPYYYDLSAAEEELSELLEHRLQSWRAAGKLSPETTLVLSTTHSWMRKATEMACERLPGRWRLVTVDRTLGSARISSDPVLLLDFINSGATADQLVNELAKRRKSPGVIFSVLKGSTAPEKIRGKAYTYFAQVETQTRPRANCPQCKIALPFSPADADKEGSSLRPFDFWHLALSVAWVAESWGPQDLPKYPSAPDFKAVFERFGDWIAYKYERLLHELGFSASPVIVAVEEPAVRELLGSLNLRFDDRLVSVLLPREEFDPGPKTKAKASTSATGIWRYQLDSLQRNQRRVLVIDEFNASGHTADRLLGFLGQQGINVSGYAPFVDFKGINRIAAVNVHALYKVPNARPA